MKRGRALEGVKSALIVLLAVSAVFLGAKTGLFSEFFGSAVRPLRPQPTASADELARKGEACRPLTVVVTGESGLRCSVRYSDAALDEVYEKLENTLGEALGSASEPELVPEAALRGALGSAGVFFDYSAALPLSALSGWLGSEMLRVNDDEASRIMLTDGGETVDLWYVAADGAARRCRTASASAALRRLIADYQPNGAGFAFELPGCEDLDPLSVITPGEILIPGLTVSVPAGQEAESALLAAFGLELYAGNSYPEPDGTTVYVGDGATLRIYSGGEAVYRRTEPAPYSPMTPGEAIELAGRAARASAGALCGDGRVYLTGLERTASGYAVTFGYTVCGVRVDGADAASIEVSGGAVSQAKVTLRSFSEGEPVDLLPEPQAAAIAQEKLPGGKLAPLYVEGGAGLVPAWTVG
ncbi:MAG: hypothetical protein IKR51_00385 [Oscillospiraceae bacterium]|nr:hypothetical protein [Oscillospiraceae bacterium]